MICFGDYLIKKTVVGSLIKKTVVGSSKLYSKVHSKRFRIEKPLRNRHSIRLNSKNNCTIKGTDIFDGLKPKKKKFLHSIGINPKEKR